MKFKQFLDNYRIWKHHYIMTPNGKHRTYEKGDGKYILFHGLTVLAGGLLFMAIITGILFWLVM